MKTDFIKQLGELKKAGIMDEKDLVRHKDTDIVISKNKVRNVRTLGDPALSAQSQKLFNPNQPKVVKGPTAAQTELGTTAASGTEGSWGKPNE